MSPAACPGSAERSRIAARFPGDHTIGRRESGLFSCEPSDSLPTVWRVEVCGIRKLNG